VRRKNFNECQTKSEEKHNITITREEDGRGGSGDGGCGGGGTGERVCVLREESVCVCLALGHI
jgi:hypothetical protein